MRAIGASEKMPSVRAGRISCLRLGHEHLPVAGDGAVDQVEAGHLRRRAVEHVEPAERRRRPAEQVVEDVDQDQAGEEHRQRHPRRRHHPAGVVDERVGVGGGEDAERHRDPHGEDQPEQGQLGGGRQPRADLGRHRLAGGERRPHVAARQVAHVADELLRQRLVEAELHPDLLDRLLGGGGPGEVGGRIARQRARQQERDDDDADQARHRQQQALQHHAQHGWRPFRPPGRCSRLHQRAVVEAAVEPVLVARHVLLHRHVGVGLEAAGCAGCR